MTGDPSTRCCYRTRFCSSLPWPPLSCVLCASRRFPTSLPPRKQHVGEGSREASPGKHRVDSGARASNSRDRADSSKAKTVRTATATARTGGLGSAGTRVAGARRWTVGVGESGHENARVGRVVSGVRRPQRPGPGSVRLLGWVARLGVSGIEPGAARAGGQSGDDLQPHRAAREERVAVACERGRRARVGDRAHARRRA